MLHTFEKTLIIQETLNRVSAMLVLLTAELAVVIGWFQLLQSYMPAFCGVPECSG